MENYGVKVMSMGFLVDEDTPMIWRGPMVQSALQQMLGDVAWGELDVLVVDMPPGTGDAQLTMAQQVPLAGAVIVTHAAGHRAARRPQGAQHVPQGRRAGARHRREHELLLLPELRPPLRDLRPRRRPRLRCKYGVDFLAEIPLDIEIRETSDDGRPIVVTEPQHPLADAYRELAMTVRDKIAVTRGGTARQFPRIVYS